MAMNRDSNAAYAAALVEHFVADVLPAAMPDGWTVAALPCMACTRADGLGVFSTWSVQATLDRNTETRCIGLGDVMQTAIDRLHLDAAAQVAKLDALTEEAK